MKRTAKMLTAALLALTLALPGTAAAADDTPTPAPRTLRLGLLDAYA